MPERFPLLNEPEPLNDEIANPEWAPAAACTTGATT